MELPGGRQAWMRAPGAWLGILTVIAGAVALWSVSSPGGSFLLQLAAMGLGVLTGAWWVVRALGYAIAVASAHENPFTERTRWFRWFAAPLVAVITVTLVAFDAPFLARYRLSRGSMDELAGQAAAGASLSGRRRVGLFWTDRVERTSNGVRFLIPGTGFLNRWGFAHAAGGLPSNMGGEDRYYPLEDGWFLWEEDW